MFLFFRSHSGPLHRSHQQPHVFQIHLRTYVDGTIKWVRDRGLDHAVEREKNLLPVMNIKDFIKSEPSKSVPVSIITQKREVLRIPTRPIDLIRKYPTIFEELLPGGIGIQPHVRLTSEVLDLDAEEQLTYQTETCRQQAADRLVRLLMLSRVHKIPVSIIDQLKWDLGLPKDYVRSIVPDFPDYFKVTGHENFASGTGDMQTLELVCWNNELATSVLEKMAAKAKPDISKGKNITFPMKFSNGFEMEKKFKKWVDEWQKLPYISPYENASHLSPNSDESDRWIVAILHELLHMLVTKKTDKENILCIGEYFDLRSRFKRALLYHPGIFYLSSKAGTYTVVLKDGYKRGSVIESSPLMNIRNKYLHLMNTMKEESKTTEHSSTRQQKQDQKEGSDEEYGKQNEAELLNSTDDEEEDEEKDENTTSHHSVRNDRKDNVCADRKDNVRKRHVDFKENASGNRVNKRHVDFKENASGNRVNKRHVDFKENAYGNWVNKRHVRFKENASGSRVNKRHVDFKENAFGNRVNKRHVDFKENASGNWVNKRHVDFKENAFGNRVNKRHVDFKENAFGNRVNKRHVDFKENASGNRVNKRHVDFKENASGNRVNKRHVDFKENASGNRVNKRHVDFKENASRNREILPRRMNSTAERPRIRNVNRERLNKFV